MIRSGSLNADLIKSTYIQNSRAMRCLALVIISSLLATGLNAQCGSWIDSPNRGEAEDAHVIYRPFVKNKDFQNALEPWQAAFDLAPAADGQRDDQAPAADPAADPRHDAGGEPVIPGLRRGGEQCPQCGVFRMFDVSHGQPLADRKPPGRERVRGECEI